MNRVYYFLFVLLFIAPMVLAAQTMKFSDFDRGDNRDMNFEIIGKMNNNILVYKNIRWKHKINIYDNDMQTRETINLDFIPEKTFNIDFVAYPDFFYMIYQYQKGRILHCMMVKMDANAKKISEPVELDTTQIPVMSDNKIYTTINPRMQLYAEEAVVLHMNAMQKKFNSQLGKDVWKNQHPILIRAMKESERWKQMRFASSALNI